MLRNLAERRELFLNGDVDRYVFNQSVQSYLGAISHSDGYELGNLLKNFLV